MAFRIAWQRLGLAQLPLVSRLLRRLPRETEQVSHLFQSPKHVSSLSGIWPLHTPPAPRDSFLKTHDCCEHCRTLSTGFRSEVEERKQSSESEDTCLSSPAEALSSEVSGSRDSYSKVPASVNVAIESAYMSSPRHDLAMLFTCTVCETRSAKTMSRATYETGVVIVRCPGCNNLHLIADRYGWFGEKGDVQEFLADKGIDVRTGSDSSYEFTVEDLAGWSPQEKPDKV